MEIGMLWFDNDKKSDYEEKIERAAKYYREKYGQIPNLCFIHPSMIPNQEIQKVNSSTLPKSSSLLKSKGVEIRTSKTMLPHHFWIGINRQETTSAL
jgi:hypothetical protein